MSILSMLGKVKDTVVYGGLSNLYYLQNEIKSQPSAIKAQVTHTVKGIEKPKCITKVEEKVKEKIQTKKESLEREKEIIDECVKETAKTVMEEVNKMEEPKEEVKEEKITESEKEEVKVVEAEKEEETTTEVANKIVKDNNEDEPISLLELSNKIDKLHEEEKEVKNDENYFDDIEDFGDCSDILDENGMLKPNNMESYSFDPNDERKERVPNTITDVYEPWY